VIPSRITSSQFSIGVMIKALFGRFKKLPRGSKLSALLYIAVVALVAGDSIWSYANGTYGPYEVIGYNYTNRHISSFIVNDFGAGASEAHQPGGGGGMACCLAIPKNAETLHVKVELEWTKEQYEKRSPHDTFETDIPVPPLPNKHDGFIEFHFLPHQRVAAEWVSFPTTPHIPDTH
jgi:hypothetical protein